MMISLYLMTQKGLKVLNAIVYNKCTGIIDTIVVGLDKSVVNDYSKEIIKLCKANDLKYFVSNQEFQINSRYILAISWRWLINKTKKSKIIVLHDSILPKYRGFAPLVNALINNEKRIGVTALFASEEYDKGDIIMQKEQDVKYPIKIKDAISSVSHIYVEIVLELFKKLKENSPINALPQNEDKATYSLWRDAEDYYINWNKSSRYIKRFIDAVGFPYLGAKCTINNEIVNIYEATIIKDVKIENRQIGKVIFNNEEKPVVVCGKGLLRIDNAVLDYSNKSLLPIKFRTRFK